MRRAGRPVWPRAVPRRAGPATRRRPRGGRSRRACVARARVDLDGDGAGAFERAAEARLETELERRVEEEPAFDRARAPACAGRRACGGPTTRRTPRDRCSPAGPSGSAGTGRPRHAGRRARPARRGCTAPSPTASRSMARKVRVCERASTKPARWAASCTLSVKTSDFFSRGVEVWRPEHAGEGHREHRRDRAAEEADAVPLQARGARVAVREVVGVVAAWVRTGRTSPLQDVGARPDRRAWARSARSGVESQTRPGTSPARFGRSVAETAVGLGECGEQRAEAALLAVRGGAGCSCRRRGGRRRSRRARRPSRSARSGGSRGRGRTVRATSPSAAADSWAVVEPAERGRHRGVAVDAGELAHPQVELHGRARSRPARGADVAQRGDEVSRSTVSRSASSSPGSGVGEEEVARHRERRRVRRAALTARARRGAP